MLVTKIRISPQRREKLTINCELYKIKDLKPILDVQTRWNSTYDIINRALLLKEVNLFILFL